MKCLDEGLLQSYIDGETDIKSMESIENHLLHCARCDAVYKRLMMNEDCISDKIAKYKLHSDESAYSMKAEPVKNGEPNRQYVFKQVYEEEKLKKGDMIMTYLRKYRKLAVGACALLILTACVTIQPVRAALADALSVFRAEEISGIYLSPEDIAEIQEQLNNNAAEIDLKTFGKIENSGGERTQVTSLQAAEFVPFTLLQPSAQGVDIREIIAADPESMSFTLKVDNLNDALKTLGSQQLLPTNLDDKTFTLNISRRIIMNCLVDGAEINFTQTTAPELVVPEGVDADELYNSLISLPIIPDNIRRQLEGIKDWKSTFYIPVTGSDTKETDINGLKGYAGTKTDEEGRTYSAVIWSGDGVIYTLEGYAGIDDIIELARSMR